MFLRKLNVRFFINCTAAGMSAEGVEKMSLRPVKPMAPRCASPKQMPPGFGGHGRAASVPRPQKRMCDLISKKILEGGLDGLDWPSAPQDYPPLYAQRDCIKYQDLTPEEWLRTVIMPIFSKPGFGKISYLPKEKVMEEIAYDFSVWERAIESMLEDERGDISPARVYSLAPISVLEYLGY